MTQRAQLLAEAPLLVAAALRRPVQPGTFYVRHNEQPARDKDGKGKGHRRGHIAAQLRLLAVGESVEIEDRFRGSAELGPMIRSASLNAGIKISRKLIYEDNTVTRFLVTRI